MPVKNIKLIREQLDTTLKRFLQVKTLNCPPKGWIRAIRDSLGMNGRQLAGRLNVHPSRITQMERDEIGGSLTLKTMRKTAEALNCVFVYGLVPESTLEDIVKKQVEKIAREQFSQVSHSMALENQELTKKEKIKALRELEEELLRTMPKSLWDTNGI